MMLHAFCVSSQCKTSNITILLFFEMHGIVRSEREIVYISPKKCSGLAWLASSYILYIQQQLTAASALHACLNQFVFGTKHNILLGTHLQRSLCISTTYYQLGFMAFVIASREERQQPACICMIFSSSHMSNGYRASLLLQQDPHNCTRSSYSLYFLKL